MKISCIHLICLYFFAASTASACATADSNPAGDAGDFTVTSDASAPTVDAVPAPDAVPPNFDAATIVPDELAPWTTGTIVATGTCRSTEVMPHSCYPSTPGRDANGCCIATIDGGTENSTLTFTIALLADGRHMLTTTACTLGIGGNPSTAVCAITATATEHVLGEPMRNPTAALKSTNFFPYVGPLSTSVSNGTLSVGFAGVADDLGTERCGHSVRYKSCTWTAP